MEDKPIKILIISGEVMLKAANQVLYQTVKGYVEQGFTVDLVMQRNSGHEAANVAAVSDLFPDDMDKIKVFDFGAKFESVFEAGRKFIRTFRKAKKPTSVVFPESNTVVGFDETRAMTFMSDLRFKANWISAYEVARKAARAARPDLICGFEVGGAVPAARLAKEMGVPAFMKYMGTIAAPYIDKGTLGLIKPYIQGLTADAELYFMLNDGTRGDEVMDHFGIEKEKVRFRIDGVNKYATPSGDATRSAIGRLVQAELKDDDFLCLCLSNHNGFYKRLDRAVRAIKDVSAAQPRARLILVGQGANTAALKTLTEELGCQGNVIFSPKVPHERILDLLSVVDVYLNTNDQSNLSHPVLEAMVAGKPVISMDDRSLKGIVSTGENGILVDPRSCDRALPAAILELVEDPEKRALYGANARRFAEENFMTWEEKNQKEIADILSILPDKK